MNTTSYKEVIFESLLDYTSANLFEASGGTAQLIEGLQPVNSSMKICGNPHLVNVGLGSNYALHRAIYNAPVNSIIVASVDTSQNFGYWGKLMSLAAKKNKIKGFVFEGSIRDTLEINDIGFPVFSTGVCVKSSSKKPSGSGVESIIIRGVEIKSSNWIFADNEGILVFPSNTEEVFLNNCQKQVLKEKDIINKLAKNKHRLYELITK